MAPDEAVGGMQYWLVEAAKEARHQSGARLETLAYLSGVSHTTVFRFLQHDRTPREVERILAALAQCAGLEDNRALWARALELWYQHGSPTQLQTTPAAGSVPLEQQIDAELSDAEAAADDQRDDQNAGRKTARSAAPAKQQATG